MVETARAIIGLEDEGSRFDSYLANCSGIRSRNQAQRLIKKGKATVAGDEKHKDYHLKIGDVVLYELPGQEVGVTAEPENLPLDIVFEDEEIVVVNKPSGMVVHPAAGNYNGTLVNALLSKTVLSMIGAPLRPGIVHRLDKDTSGLMVVVKTDKAYMSLVDQMKKRLVKREYLALVEGNFNDAQGHIDAPIKRNPKDRKLFMVAESGKEAISDFRVVSSVPGYSLLVVRLFTGRTHQIRVHMKFIKHTIVGDLAYGSARTKKLSLKRQWLHAFRLEFTHPVSGEALSFQKTPPADLMDYLSKIELKIPPSELKSV
ncbi:hypothetical protein LCGC14_2953320 [marine sediment metagenome]|uniref:Pseudouridine synthase RsuA/RluA-like domain-containing protein n=1 Tax=marine sediment metagenome TaxID=412755 RepID=A0A0F8XEC3_9ZZZZ|nr:RluA family pseudouridine synthase [Actinomycetota bacterium]